MVGACTLPTELSKVQNIVTMNLENILAVSRKTNLEIFLATTRIVSSYLEILQGHFFLATVYT